MNVNDLLVIVLLLIAVTDTILSQTLLPKLIKRYHPEITPAQAKMITKAVDFGTMAFFCLAIAIYIAQPL